MNFNGLLFFLELIGSGAFAVSGVMVAKENHMDLFGAIVLGCVTAVGGGIIRDLILGITPPSMFVDPVYVFCAFVVSLITFLIEYHPSPALSEHEAESNFVLNVADTIGLAVFAVVGARTAMLHGYAQNSFLCVFVGTVTGIGGGILRDMMAGQMPLIMRERIYGVAAIFGSMLYVLLMSTMQEIPATFLSILATILLRGMAIRFNWNLPRLH